MNQIQTLVETEQANLGTDWITTITNIGSLVLIYIVWNKNQIMLSLSFIHICFLQMNS